jgi:histidinol-phosphate phosphatase family protein
MKKTMICVDRDGTLAYDEKDHLFLGRTEDWKSKVKLLPVIDGLKLLKTIPDSAVYMITNQPGVAISDFPLLTVERAHEVCKYIVDRIKGMGAHIDGYFLCPHANRDYVKRYGNRFRFDKKLVCECDCIKPGLGMVFDALKSEQVTPEEVDIYMIGDRATDVETAMNIGGTGILIPFENQPGEDRKVTTFKDLSHVYIARDMLDAAKFIVSKENRFVSAKPAGRR